MSIFSSKPVQIVGGLLVLVGLPRLVVGLHTGQTPQAGSWGNSGDVLQLVGGVVNGAVGAIAEFAGETTDQPAIPAARPESNSSNGAAPVERQRANTQASGLGSGSPTQAGDGVELDQMLED